jgi:hypothetical protein
MPAPSAENAWERAIQIIVIPSIIVLLAVTITHSVYGTIVAGLVLNMASLLVLVGVAAGAIYWNTEYTAIIAIGGTLLFFYTPGILSRLVHPALAAVNSLFVLGFLGYIWLLLAGKLGLDVPSW